MFNQLTAYGRLVRDPELRYVNAASGTVAVCNISIACSDVSTSSGEKREYTGYFDFVFWDSQAENIAKYMKKGDPILAIGTGRTETWEDAQGTKRSRLRFKGSTFRFGVGSKAREKPTAPEGAAFGLPSSFPNPDTMAAEIIDDQADLLGEIDDDEIPF